MGDVPGSGATAAAGLARVEHPEVDLLLGPGDRLLERDPQVVAQVRAGLRPPAPRRGGRRAAEERVEDVAEPTEPGGAEPEVPLASATDPGPAEHVVALAAIRVGQHLVRLVDLLEALLRRGVRVDVGVPLLGELAERPLDLGVGGAPFHAEDGVVVEFGGHSTVKDTRGRPRTRSGARLAYASASSRAPPKDGLEHRWRQHPGERVLLARVVRAEEPVRPDRRLGAVPEARLRPDDVALRGEQPEPGIPRVRPERHDDPNPGQQPELEREPRRARVALLDRRLVGGRRAAHRRRDVRVEQRQAVVGAAADRPVGEPDRVQRSEEEVARRIAGEDPTGPVAAVRRRRESEQQDARIRVTEAGHGTRPVGLVAEAGDLLAGHPLAPLDQPRAATALHDLGGQRREGCPVGRRHAISAGACRAAGS